MGATGVSPQRCAPPASVLLLTTVFLAVLLIVAPVIVAPGPPASLANASGQMNAAATAECRADITPRMHRSRYLGSGARLEIHTATQRVESNRTPRSVRIAVVAAKIGRTGLSARMTGPPDLIHPRTVAGDSGVIAVMNGDYFDDLPGGGTIPRGMVVNDGRILFAPSRWSPVVAVDDAGRVRTTAIKAVLTRSQRSPITVSVNDPLDPGDGIAVYTPDWNREKTPVGLWRLVVDRGRVIAWVRPSRSVDVPRDGFVLASRDKDRLRPWKAGEEFTETIDVVARDGGAVTGASGHGGVVLREATKKAACSDYENLLRPRTALAWNDEGDVWLITVTSGQPDPADGFRRGGATKSQVAGLAHDLGATHAVTLDGGGSTALFTQRSGRVDRRDMPESSWTRPVPVVWTLERRS